MKEEDKKHEYVLSDTGLIWRGTHNNQRKTPWKYGQFEKDILECSLYLFTHVSPVKTSFRNDVMMISRCLSAAVSVIYIYPDVGYIIFFVIVDLIIFT